MLLFAIMDAEKLAKSLTPQQRLALVGVKAGFITYGGLYSRHDTIPHYYAFKGSEAIKVQSLNQVSRICHALFTRGLIANENTSSPASLTALGQEVFDLVVTEAEKEDLAREKRWAKQAAIQRAKDARGHAYDEANRERRNANNDRRQESYYEIQRLKTEILEIAAKLAVANDIDELLSENRRLVKELQSHIAIQAECDALTEEMRAERETARDHA